MDESGYRHFCASFRVTDALSLHSELTARFLEFQDCISVTRSGDPIPYLRDRHSSQDVWLLNSPLDETESATLHLAWLDERLRPHIAYLKGLMARGVDLDIFLGYRSDCNPSDFVLQPGFMNAASTIGIPIRLSVIII